MTYKGKPVTVGSVIYEREGGGASEGALAGPEGGPFRVIGKIQEDGTFRLSAFPGAEGIPEGHYKVGISSRSGRSETGIFDLASRIKKGNPDVLRGRDADPKTSGLVDEVAKDRANEPTFDLK